ncbi:putative GTPase [Handroanthus impetiginosus]|uniref:Putative GTPase n=1 Tax=Handroanthus impetiginosus TaxID=429701 RepID=A0A2G9FZE2_9LAMI|nr:putative GTPase [Handroanthus impetiginosus]
MPAQRSSSKNGANKTSRKVRGALGKSEGSGDGVRKLGLKSSIVGKAHRKVRVASDVDRTKNKGSRKGQSRNGDDDAVTYVDASEKLSGKGRRGKRDLKTRTGNEGLEAVMDRNLGRKRKRIYADPGMVEDSKSSSKSKSNVVESDLGKGKKVPRGKDHEFNDSSRKTSLVGSNKLMGSELLDKKVRRSKREGADKLKNVQENGLGNRTSKTNGKGKIRLATEKRDLNWGKYTVGSVEKQRKKKDQGKKNSATDSDLMEKPKKKKRVIRIDPHDISNKRLDDEKANNGSLPKKIDSAENSVEMSKNAQFRAIRPSPSILSFVEDNLLGRRRDIEFRRAGYNTELSAPLDNIPFSTSSERERIEIPIFRNKLEFFAAAKISSSFPSPDLPEIAFAGRSNVGKSSLLNALTRQWGVVRTSDKPGLTQTINFFKLGSKLCLVDLPGYGFAYAKEEVKEAWEELVKEYVSTRVGLKRVCLLVDTKWGMKPRDHELIDLMERSQTKYQIVLTKTDTVFPMDVARRAMQIEENLKEKKSAVQPLMMVSSKTGAGIRSLRTVLANVARLVRR